MRIAKRLAIPVLLAVAALLWLWREESGAPAHRGAPRKVAAPACLLHADPCRAQPVEPPPSPLPEKVRQEIAKLLASNDPVSLKAGLSELKGESPEAAQRVAEQVAANPERDKSVRLHGLEYACSMEFPPDEVWLRGLYERETDPDVKKAALDAVTRRK